MSRAGRAGAFAAVIAAAALGGFALLGADLRPSTLPQGWGVARAAAQTGARAIIYYKDPDGRPDYSPEPRKTTDGRDYLPVYADEDVSVEKPSPARPQEGRKIKYYRNPMGLPDISSTPKKDSMGMDYIPVYEGEDSDDAIIRLSPGKLQRTGVKSEPIAARVIHAPIRAPGTIQLDERRVTVIAMRAESYLLKVEDATTGTPVRKGQPLMRVYSPAVSLAAADYMSALASAGDARAALRGARLRLINLGVPEAMIAQMEQTRVVPSDLVWTAPRDGLILERNAVEGMRAEAGMVLFRLADISGVWAMIEIAERDLAALKIGQPVAVRARAYPGRVFAGVVGVVYPQINRDTRTIRARIELANADAALMPDMYVDAEVDAGAPDPVLAAPESAIIDAGARQVAFVDRGEGRLEPREVKLGTRGGGFVEIREGLKEGESVVVSANFLIDAESNLRAAMKAFAGAGEQK